MDEHLLPELLPYPEVMTPAHVAELLHLDPELVARHMRSHRLPGFKVGGAWRVLRRDIQAVMEGTWEGDSEATEKDE